MNVAIITESFIVYLLSSHFDMILSTDHIFHFDMIYLVLRLKTKQQLYYDYFKILKFSKLSFRLHTTRNVSL